MTTITMETGDRHRARAKLGQLKEQFAERLRRRLDELDALVVRASEEPGPGILGEAIAAAHRLAGTAGSYGFVEVGEAAAGLERALQSIAGGRDEWPAANAAMARARAARP